MDLADSLGGASSCCIGAHHGAPPTMLRTSCLLLSLAAAARAEMTLTVDSTTGAYTVAVGGATWFTSAATGYTSGGKMLSTADGSLKLQGATKGSGSDASGEYKGTTLTWDGGAFVTEFREYSDMIVFEQSFPKGVQGTNSDAETDPYSLRDDVSSAFPAFVTNATGQQGFLAFSGDMTGSGAKYGRGLDVPSGVSGFGPTCFFSEDLKTSVVLSSFSQFMAASNSVGGGTRRVRAAR